MRQSTSRNYRPYGDAPSHTPRADPLQAWSAAAVPFMVSELLGLQPDGFAKQLRVHDPLLPDGVDALTLHGLRVGDASVSLSFSRQPDGASMQVIANESGIEVVIS